MSEDLINQEQSVGLNRNALKIIAMASVVIGALPVCGERRLAL